MELIMTVSWVIEISGLLSSSNENDYRLGKLLLKRLFNLTVEFKTIMFYFILEKYIN